MFTGIPQDDFTLASREPDTSKNTEGKYYDAIQILTAFKDDCGKTQHEEFHTKYQGGHYLRDYKAIPADDIQARRKICFQILALMRDLLNYVRYSEYATSYDRKRRAELEAADGRRMN